MMSIKMPGKGGQPIRVNILEGGDTRAPDGSIIDGRHNKWLPHMPHPSDTDPAADPAIVSAVKSARLAAGVTIHPVTGDMDSPASQRDPDPLPEAIRESGSPALPSTDPEDPEW